ncbi:hypothetical protein JTB14_011042 [Gonioctena quinquepunctata]|nr:hypothetical protein JTB14_011042 [Gonioctena quinquepunctata]
MVRLVECIIISTFCIASSENNFTDTFNSISTTETIALENYSPVSTKPCACRKTEPCIRKCCQPGFYHFHVEDPGKRIFESFCIRNESSQKLFTVPIYNKETKIHNSIEYTVCPMQCNNNDAWQYFKMNNLNPEELYYIQKNGSLYYPHSKRKFYDNDRYCVDEEDGLSVYLCYSPDDPATILSRIVSVLGIYYSTWIFS